MPINFFFPQTTRKAAPFNKNKTAAKAEPYFHQFHYI